jgi:flagellin
MSVINTNTASMRAANSSATAGKMLGTAMERLSTGKRINSAKDDAAGLAIATTMTSSIKGMNQGIRNANDGISLAQTAEGALNEVTNMLQRVRELAVQSASGTYSASDRTNMQKEVTQLASQMSTMVTNSEFNGVKLFDNTAGTAGVVTIQTGSESTDTVALTMANLTTLKTAVDTAASFSVEDTTKSTALLAIVDTQLDAISGARATLGAGQSRLESVVNSQTSNVANLSDARSRIEDTDYSAETAALAKAQILSQASTAMLSQANQSQQNVLSLLR